MYEPKTIQQAIMPLLVMNFLFGMAMFDFNAKRYLKREYAYTVGILVLYGSMYKLTTPYFDKYFVISLIDLNQFMQKSIYISNVTVTFMLIIIVRIKAKGMRKLMALVKACDKSMAKMGLSAEYGTLFTYQIKNFSVFTFYILLYCTLLYNWHFVPSASVITRLTLVFLVHVPFFIICICDISFCFWIKYLKIKFEQLNQLLQGMLTTTPESPQHKRVLSMKYDFENKKFMSQRNERVRGTNGNTNTLRAVKQMHLEIIKIVRVINESFGIQVLLLMTVSFIFTTGLLYVLYRIIWLDLTTSVLMQELIPIVCSIFGYSSQILYMNHICAKTNIEASFIGDIICELYEPSTSKEFRAEIRDFTLQLIQNPLVFTAYGFFNLDHAFIQGVIGTITTYLVILIQVGDMSKPRLINSTLDATENDTAL